MRARRSLWGASVKVSHGGFSVAFASAIASGMVTVRTVPESVLALALASGAAHSVIAELELGWSSLSGRSLLRPTWYGDRV